MANTSKSKPESSKSNPEGSTDSADGNPKAVAGSGKSFNHRRNRIMVASAAVAIVVVGAAVAAFVHFSSTKPVPEVVETPAPTQVAVNSLQDITFTALAAPGEFTLQPGDSAAKHLYVRKDGMCEVQFGTASAANLPGKTPAEVVDGALSSWRNNGYTAADPVKSTIMLASAGTTATKYTMPTFSYHFTKGSAQAQVAVSAALLGSGDRAFIIRSCQNKKGSVDIADLQALDRIVQQIAVETAKAK